MIAKYKLLGRPGRPYGALRMAVVLGSVLLGVSACGALAYTAPPDQSTGESEHGKGGWCQFAVQRSQGKVWQANTIMRPLRNTLATGALLPAAGVHPAPVVAGIPASQAATARGVAFLRPPLTGG